MSEQNVDVKIEGLDGTRRFFLAQEKISVESLTSILHVELEIADHLVFRYQDRDGDWCLLSNNTVPALKCQIKEDSLATLTIRASLGKNQGHSRNQRPHRHGNPKAKSLSHKPKHSSLQKAEFLGDRGVPVVVSGGESTRQRRVRGMRPVKRFVRALKNSGKLDTEEGDSELTALLMQYVSVAVRRDRWWVDRQTSELQGGVFPAPAQFHNVRWRRIQLWQNFSFAFVELTKICGKYPQMKDTILSVHDATEVLGRFTKLENPKKEKNLTQFDEFLQVRKSCCNFMECLLAITLKDQVEVWEEFVKKNKVRNLFSDLLFQKKILEFLSEHLSGLDENNCFKSTTNETFSYCSSCFLKSRSDENPDECTCLHFGKEATTPRRSATLVLNSGHPMPWSRVAPFPTKGLAENEIVNEKKEQILSNDF